MSSRGVVVVGLLVALAVGAGLVASGKSGLGSRAARYHFEKARVERGDLTGRVTATGTLSALVTVQVGSQVSGRIAELCADFGSRVQRGQVIARLDPQLFQAAVEQARANRNAGAGTLDKARAEAENADHQLGRTRELARSHLVASADLDAAIAKARATKAAVVAAQGNLEQARAAYDQAQVNLGYTTIISPIGGVVISRNVDVGQTVAASLQAPTLFTIAEDLGKMLVHAAVSEADVGRLAPSMPASFTVDAYPDERFSGVIQQIRDAPQTLQNVVTYDAVIAVGNADHRLKPGMTANVTFQYADRKGVLSVPTAALRFHPSGDLLASIAGGVLPATHKKHKEHDHGKAMAAPAPAAAARGPATPGPASKRTVWLLRDNALSEVAVDVGVVDGNRVEVRTDRLSEGDVVVTDAIDKTERAETKPKPKKGLF